MSNTEKGADQGNAGNAPEKAPEVDKKPAPEVDKKPAPEVDKKPADKPAKAEKSAAERQLEKKLKDAEADQADLRAQLEHMQALFDQVLAKQAEAELAASIVVQPAKILSLLVYSRGGCYLTRDPESGKEYQFQKLFPGSPASAMSDKGQHVNVNHFENGEVGVTFYRGFYRAKTEDEMAFFRRRATRNLPDGQPNPKFDFQMMIAKEEVA